MALHGLRTGTFVVESAVYLLFGCPFKLQPHTLWHSFHRANLPASGASRCLVGLSRWLYLIVQQILENLLLREFWEFTV